MLHTWEKFNSTTKKDYIVEETTFEKVQTYYNTNGYVSWSGANYEEENHRFELTGRSNNSWGKWVEVGMVFKDMPFTGNGINGPTAAILQDNYNDTYYLVTEATGSTNNKVLSGKKYSIEYKDVLAMGNVSQGFVSSKDRNAYKDNKQASDGLWYVYKGIK